MKFMKKFTMKVPDGSRKAERQAFMTGNGAVGRQNRLLNEKLPVYFK